MLRGIWTASLMLFVGVAGQSQDIRKISLNEALKTAVKNNLDIQLEKVNVSTSEMDFRLTRAVYEPTISNTTDFSTQDSEAATANDGAAGSTISSDRANFDTRWEKREDFGLGWRVDFNNNFNETTQAISLGETYTSTLTLSGTQELLRGGIFDRDSIRKDEYVARGNYGISKADLAVRIIDTMELAEQAYWDLVLAMEEYKVAQNSLQLSKQLYDQNKIKIEVGTMAPIELVNTEADVAQKESDLVSRDNDIRTAEDRLKKILNLEPEEWEKKLIPTDQPSDNFLKVSTAEAYDVALQNRVEMRKDSLQTSNAELEYNYRKNQLLPQLSVGASHTSLGTSVPARNQMTGEILSDAAISDSVEKSFQNDFPGWSVSLNLNWKPFNKDAKINLAKAKAEIRRRELTTGKLKLDILEEVRGAVRSIEINEKKIKAQEKTLKFREENLKAEVQKFQNGLTTNYRVSEVQDELAQARNALIRAKIDYQKAVLSYYKAIGRLHSERGISID